MKESEQFDDLTTTDPSMPPPEKATMSLEDFHAGDEPEFEPIHEEQRIEENAYSFYGIESYLLPKN